jgi:hypothetical protein
MADEFIKGLAIFTFGGLAWIVLAGWYQTPSFEGTQLVATPEEAANLFDTIAISLVDVMLWFAIFGALAFWVVIPAIREGRRALED